MFISSVFHAVVGLADSGLEGLATLLTPALGGLAAAGAVVAFTVLVRLLVSPLSWLQARAARRGAALAPQIAELRERHRADPAALATETLALHRAHGAGPGKSLLPGLVQAPFFMVMYRVVQPVAGVATGVLAGSFLGVPMTAHLIAGFPVFAGLLALAAALAVWSSARARRLLTPADSPGAAGAGSSAAAPAIGRVLTYLPYLTILVVAYLPLAGAIYLVTSTGWTAFEQAIWRRPGIAMNR
jgi:YidC/Oxa1 family membrane protein insertase